MGELPVSARLVMGSEHLRLLFTNTRILVVQGGKAGSGAGAVVGTSILGGLGSALGGLFKGGTGSKVSVKKMVPSQVLRAHRDNFPIDYREVVSVNIRQTSMLTNITILTGGDKFEFSSRSRFDEIVRIFNSALAEKLTVERIS
jgi:hypothetical protein